MPLECIIFAQIQFLTPKTTRPTYAQFQSDFCTSNRNSAEKREYTQRPTATGDSTHDPARARSFPRKQIVREHLAQKCAVSPLRNLHSRSDIFTPARSGADFCRSVQIGPDISTYSQWAEKSIVAALIDAVQIGPEMSTLVCSGLWESLNCPDLPTADQSGLLNRSNGPLKSTCRYSCQFEGREGGGGIRLFVVQKSEGLAQAVREREPAVPVAGSEVPV
mgnify:CR=1 FL=1